MRAGEEGKTTERITDITACEGKQVRRMVQNGERMLAVHFADDTYLVVSATTVGYSDAEAELWYEEGLSESERSALGLMSAAEYEAWQRAEQERLEQRARAREEHTKNRELAELRRLQEKYGKALT